MKRQCVTSIMILLLLCMILASCAAMPAQHAPTYNESQVGEPDINGAILILYRKMVPPVAYSVTATINDESFATLPNNSFAWKYLSPGDYEIKITWPIIAMTFGKTIKLSVEAGQYYFVNFGGDFNILMLGTGAVGYSTHNLAVQNTEGALREIKECCRQAPSEPQQENPQKEKNERF